MQLSFKTHTTSLNITIFNVITHNIIMHILFQCSTNNKYYENNKTVQNEYESISNCHYFKLLSLPSTIHYRVCPRTDTFLNLCSVWWMDFASSAIAENVTNLFLSGFKRENFKAERPKFSIFPLKFIVQ